MYIFFLYWHSLPRIVESLLLQSEIILTKALNGVLEMTILLGSSQRSAATREAFTLWVDKGSSNPRFAGRSVRQTDTMRKRKYENT